MLPLRILDDLCMGSVTELDHKTFPYNSTRVFSLYLWSMWGCVSVCVRLCVCACVNACVCACVCACVHACMRACVSVFAYEYVCVGEWVGEWVIECVCVGGRVSIWNNWCERSLCSVHIEFNINGLAYH